MTRPRSVTENRHFRIDSGWEFASAAPGSTPDQLDQLDWKPTSTPNTAAGALRDLKAWNWDSSVDFDGRDWWWRVQLIASHGVSGKVVLGFDGLATLADVWIDGNHLLHSDNMFIAHEVPIGLEATHELLIRCAALTPELAKKRPRPRWRVPMLPHARLRWFRTTLLGRTPGWSPPCPAVGPWRPVWIEQRRLTIGTTDVRSRVEDECGIVDVSIELDDAVRAANLVVERGEMRVTGEMRLCEGRWQGSVQVESAALWWPHTHGEPACYGVLIEARHGDDNITIDLGRTGFRTVEILRGGGDFGLRINGIDVFCRGACWTPLDVVKLAAAPEDLKHAIEQIRAAGMNMVRVCGTMVYEDDAFYDALDACGILLWQDLMFANMDYPEDESFLAGVIEEIDQQLARLQGRPCLTLVCGNSEVEQQAAMSAAAREFWSPPLFNRTIASRVEALGVAYIPSSAHGGAFPHAANAGTSSYYGVGAYLRPLDDARRSELVFASECLAFANIPYESGLPGGPALRVHHPIWKSRSPRDLGAGWDFDDVRDHYVSLLYGVDPAVLRARDHARYLALGRAATGEIMASAFAEWRRKRASTRGALIWFLRDLWPGAGWGVVDAHGHPKPCFHALRRVLAPTTLAFSDEGVNGLALHVFHDGPGPLAARLGICLYHAGEIRVGEAECDLRVPAHGNRELVVPALFDGFHDLSYAYRFGPPMANLVHATLHVGEVLVADAFWFPVGQPASREQDVGLTATVSSGNDENEYLLQVGTRRFAQSVSIEAPDHAVDDDYFHLAPGQVRNVLVKAKPGMPATPLRGTISALNVESTARFQFT